MTLLPLEKIQEEELNIALEIDRFCKNHDLRYFLSDGTLLGAVRHEGFIPWDDDMDLYMLRDDYDYFCRNFIHDHLTVIYPENGTFDLPFAKVINKNISVIQDIVSSTDLDYLWVDIFPLDGNSNFKIIRNIRGFIYSKMYYLLMINRTPNQNKLRDTLKHIVLFPFYNRDTSFYTSFAAFAGKYLKKYKPFSTRFLSMGKHVYPAEIFSETDEYKFNGFLLQSVKDADRYLTITFGDYMILPPLSQRKGHNIKAYYKE